MFVMNGNEEVESGSQDDKDEKRIAGVSVPDARHVERSGGGKAEERKVGEPCCPLLSFLLTYVGSTPHCLPHHHLTFTLWG